MIHLCKVIKNRGLKQAEAAKILGVTQPRISDLLQGRIHLFSIDTLVDMLGRAAKAKTKSRLTPYNLLIVLSNFTRDGYPVLY
jgi:predicted XRE-type DNA-binding protein